MKAYETPVWAEIDLGAIRHNVRVLQDRVGPNVQLIAVVKANAYGHGAVAVSRAVLDAGASSLAVARVSEGVALRRAGITAPILVMGYSLPAEAGAIVADKLSPTVNTLALADALEHFAAQQSDTLPVYLKVDTGMGRFGLLPDEVLPFARNLQSRSHLHLAGLWTHYAVADEADKSYTWLQYRRYRQVVDTLESAGITLPQKFTANSAAILDLPDVHLDAVRAGIALYGLYPSQEVAGRAAASGTELESASGASARAHAGVGCQLRPNVHDNARYTYRSGAGRLRRWLSSCTLQSWAGLGGRASGTHCRTCLHGPVHGRFDRRASCRSGR